MVEEHKNEIAEGTYDIERGLAAGWSSLDEPTKSSLLQRFEAMKKQLEADKEAGSSGPRQTVFDAAPSHVDEDVEMGDTDVGTPSAAGENGGGFTAVNRA